ncbi:MAG: hypothetical protein FRX49_02020 [Trebouxia sp. A1-2]|nr:MAG: hypothetical protein FRX49_02020 [Trebouxia sp. A1-2]
MDFDGHEAVFAQKDYTLKVCIQAPPLLVWQLKDIVQLSAPTNVWQDAGCPGACPDILPAVAPCEVIAQAYEDSV